MLGSGWGQQTSNGLLQRRSAIVARLTPRGSGPNLVSHHDQVWRSVQFPSACLGARLRSVVRVGLHCGSVGLVEQRQQFGGDVANHGALPIDWLVSRSTHWMSSGARLWKTVRHREAEGCPPSRRQSVINPALSPGAHWLERLIGSLSPTQRRSLRDSPQRALRRARHVEGVVDSGRGDLCPPVLWPAPPVTSEEATRVRLFQLRPSAISLPVHIYIARV